MIKEYLIKRKIELLIKKYQKKAKEENRFYFLASPSIIKRILDFPNTIESLKYIQEVYISEDNGYIPLEVSDMIENILDESDYCLAIHRVGAHHSIHNPEDSLILKSVFNVGVKNNGDGMQGVQRLKIPPIEKTFSFVNNIYTASVLLKTKYKATSGSIIARFPKEYVNNIHGEYEIVNGMDINIYSFINAEVFVKPKFLLGYVENDEKGNCHYYPKEFFLEKNSDIIKK